MSFSMDVLHEHNHRDINKSLGLGGIPFSFPVSQRGPLFNEFRADYERINHALPFNKVKKPTNLVIHVTCTANAASKNSVYI